MSANTRRAAVTPLPAALPSPQLHEYEVIDPPLGSVEAEPFTLTGSGAEPDTGVAVKEAIGG